MIQIILTRLITLVVAGGGGGYGEQGDGGGGGGGAGAVRYATNYSVSAQPYSIVIGAGGNAAKANNSAVVSRHK